jgi:hypothetical protein
VVNVKSGYLQKYSGYIDPQERAVTTVQKEMTQPRKRQTDSNSEHIVVIGVG